MSTFPAENPVPGVVTFTVRGDAALDQLAAALKRLSAKAPARIADILEQVLDADIEHLAKALSETAGSAGPRQLAASDDVTDLDLAPPDAELAVDPLEHALLLSFCHAQHLAFDDYVRTASVTQRREWGKIAGRFEDVPFLETAEQSLRLIACAVTDSTDIDPNLVDRRSSTVGSPRAGAQ